MNYRLLATLVLIIVHSIYMGQVVQASMAPLAMRICDYLKGCDLYTVMSVRCIMAFVLL